MALRRQAGPVPIGQILDELSIPSFLTGTATPGISFGTAGLVSFSQPIHLDAIQTLYIREYAALRNVTDTMRGQIARVLTEGVQEGLNTRDIAANMVDRVDKIGITRARLIAQTETIRAYNIGSINEGERVGIEAGVEVKYLWQSSEDGRVRPKHALWNQQLMQKKTALARIGEPNCRCGIEPTVVEDLDSEEREDMRERKKRGLALATR
jgi:SPP1 gp7 family putative phage head morphogenesis protein